MVLRPLREHRSGPMLLLQRVPEPKTTKMAEPEGNEFCVYREWEY